MARAKSKQVQAPAPAGVKPYNIAIDGNKAEINMYGEVVDVQPTDWWTGEPIPGNFIALDAFLMELDELKNKDEITIHLNTVGGSAHAGLAIRNRLREMKNVTIIVDSLAASAGSMILQGASKGKRFVRSASQVMVHPVSGLLWGYYNTADLQEIIDQFDSIEKAYCTAYVESGGQDSEKVAADLKSTIWMVGQEAVDAGYADAVLAFDNEEGENTEPVRQLANRAKMQNGLPQTWQLAARLFMPIDNKVPAAAMQPVTNKQQKQEENNDMEIKNMDDLRNANPELAKQIENDAKAAGVAAERARIKGIEAIENAIADKNLVNEAKYGENPMTAEQLAFKAMQSQAAIGATMLNNLTNDTKDSGADGVTGSAAEDAEQSDDEKAVALMMAAVKNMEV